jgi:hypothetical protein
MKTVTFSIRPLSEVVDDFAETFDVVRTGRPIPKKPRDEVGFTSIEAARNFLTRERVAQAHDSNAPSRLALWAGENGQPRFQERPGGYTDFGAARSRADSQRAARQRKVKVPQVPFEEIALKIAIRLRCIETEYDA